MNQNLPATLPPHNLESEQGVLGCLLTAPDECMGASIDAFKAGAEVFYDLRHQELYRAMLVMYDARQPIDLITLTGHLKNVGKLDQVGGLCYITALPDAIASAANFPFYADIVAEKYLLRRLLQTCHRIITSVYEQEGEAQQVLDIAERDILALAQERGVKGETPIRELVKQSISDIEREWEAQGKPDGLASGFGDLDRLTGGLHGGEMVIIAARPSAGKTSLAMNIAEHVSCDCGQPVGVFSLEMSDRSLVKRMLCSRARVNLRGIRDGNLGQGDFAKLTMAAPSIAKAPLWINDTGGLSVRQMASKARRLKREHGVKLFVIDYLQLLNSLGGARRSMNQQEEVSEISQGIKNLAKELGVPFIVLSQLNRAIEHDKKAGKRSRRPRLADLRGSGSIEQDADFVGLLYHKGGEEEDDKAESDIAAVSLLIAKQRNGPADVEIPLTFFKAFTRFEPAAKVDDADIPDGRLPYHDK